MEDGEGIAGPGSWTPRTDPCLAALSHAAERKQTDVSLRISGTSWSPGKHPGLPCWERPRWDPDRPISGRLAGLYFMEGSWSGPHLEDHGKWDLVKSLRIWENSVWGVGDLLMVLDDEDQMKEVS